MVGIPLILLLAVAVLVMVIAIQRSAGKTDDKGNGADVVPYLVLALAMGVAGFSLAELAATAFPGESFVFDPADELATSLAGLVVSAPFVMYFWRRQALRRLEHPTSAGWTLYLSLIELVFMTAFVVTGITFVNGLLTDDAASGWPRVVVFGAIVVLHEVAATKTPPISDAGELRRVIGSVIGLVPAAIGLAAILTTLLGETGLFTDPLGTGEYHPFLAMLLVGAPLWWYRWLRPWDSAPSMPRLTWAVVASVGSLAVALGAATALVALIFVYLLTSTPSAATHFGAVPAIFGLIITGGALWWVHRSTLHEAGGSPLAVYRYGLAALGIATSVTMAIVLTIMAFAPVFPGPQAGEIIQSAVILISGIAIWLLFERQATKSDEPLHRWPRTLYTLGVGIVAGLVAAGALITTLVILIRRMLDGTDGQSVLEPATALFYSGLATWYLLGTFFREREPGAVKAEPFNVTIICSHPGMLATELPDHATLRVLYRGDQVGAVDEAMAREIVEAVDGRSSLVWVDDRGFRVAPTRSQS